MRSRLRTIFFVSVIPCIPIVFALTYWILASSCSNQYTSVDVHRLQVDTPLPQKLNRILNNSVKDSNQIERDDTPPHPKKTLVDVNRLEAIQSEHEDIDVRGKFQRERMSMFCRQNFISRERKYPEGGALDAFHRHLMFDDAHKVIFCFVPKAGCTNMKRLMLYMGNRLPMDTIDWPWVEDSIYLEPALKHVSLLNKTLTEKQKSQRMNDYYKFMIVRNPFERLVSGYRNKLEKPVRYDQKSNFPESVKMSILRKYRKAELKYWSLTQKSKPFNISVTFSEFVRYVVESSIPDMNEHFQPIMDICHPCIVKYDFYVNFRNISHDVKQLIAKFRTDPRFYRDESLHNSREQTSVVMEKYYSTLSHRDKVQLLGAWYDEILFYYTLYPSERDSHRRLLGIDIPIL